MITELLTPYPTTPLKILLAVAPQSHPPTAPHAAVPYLTGYLRHVFPNITVDQKDFDALYYSWLFRDQLPRHFSSPTLQQTIQAAYEGQQQTIAYTDIPSFIAAKQTLEDTLDIVSQQHRDRFGLRKEGLQLRGNTFTYVSETCGESREDIIQGIENRKTNIFYDFFKEYAVPHIVEAKYDLVGFSVFLGDQLIPTFVLASLIKDYAPKTSVVIGGNYITRFRDLLSQDDALNETLLQRINALVIGEGYKPLREIIIELDNSKKEQRKPNLRTINQVITFTDKVESRLEPVHANTHFDLMPTPDLEGILTDYEGRRIYWMPQDVAPLYTEMGCKWENVCDFCVIPFGDVFKTIYGERSAEKVADDMAQLQQKHGIRIYDFGNQTLSKDFMKSLSQELAARGLEATLAGYTRTDQLLDGGAIDTDLLATISPYFRFLQIGFEAQDQEILNSMRKKRSSASDSEIVQSLFTHGIYPHAFIITGFPPAAGQNTTDDEYVNAYVRSTLQSLRWLRENAQAIGTFKATSLLIPQDDKKMVRRVQDSVYINPDFEHELALLPIQKDLAFNIPYRKVHGSKALDDASTALFEILNMPYRFATHYIIYHQRLADGMWSRIVQNRIPMNDPQKEKKVLHAFWKTAVGAEYIAAQQELQKEHMQKKKREALQRRLREKQQTNLIAKHFPNGISSIDQLLALPI